MPRGNLHKHAENIYFIEGILMYCDRNKINFLWLFQLALFYYTIFYVIISDTCEGRYHACRSTMLYGVTGGCRTYYRQVVGSSPGR